jgi:uncharacterized protein YbjT (DUF2867 family)
MEKRTVLVAGSTGNQGGSVARVLLREGHKVLGITRNVNSPNAEALKALGAQMVSVSMSDQESLIEIMTEVDTVFAMTTPLAEAAITTPIGSNLSYCFQPFLVL